MLTGAESDVLNVSPHNALNDMGVFNTVIGRDTNVVNGGSYNVLNGANNRVGGNRNIVIGNGNSVTGSDNLVIGNDITVVGDNHFVTNKNDVCEITKEEVFIRYSTIIYESVQRLGNIHKNDIEDRYLL